MIVFFAALNFSFSFGQINYEATYTLSPVIKYFNHTSPKWMTRSPNSDTIVLYNLNHSFFRQILVAPQPPGYNIYFLSDDLFDTDSTNFEYLIAKNNPPNQFVKIYREDGTLLFSRDSAWIVNTALMTNSEYYSIAQPTDSGTKLMLLIYNPHFSRTEIYSLPGTIPCSMICNGVPWFVNGVEPPGNSSDNNLRLPFPNPTQGQTHIPYTLPDGEASGEIIFYDMAGAEVKRYKVDKTFSDLILSTADLSTGSYYYQLVTQHSKSEGKKLIVIK